MKYQAIQPILNYFPSLTDTQKNQFANLEAHYVDWNKKINLISRKDIDNLYTHHVLHSLSIAQIVKFKPNKDVLDAGTGGGFPGIPLAICFPKTNFVLVDSTAKKIKAVNDIIQNIALKNVTAYPLRVENVSQTYDFITGRGVTNLTTFYNWVKDKLKTENKHAIRNGVLYLKGMPAKEEHQQKKVVYQIYPIKKFFKEAFFDTKYVIHLSPTSCC